MGDAAGGEVVVLCVWTGLARIWAAHLWEIVVVTARCLRATPPLQPHWSKGQPSPLRPSATPILFQMFCSSVRVMGTVQSFRLGQGHGSYAPAGPPRKSQD